VKKGLEKVDGATCNECGYNIADIKIQTTRIDKTHTINFKVCPNCNTENPTGRNKLNK
jgi:protein-arginine kinase activator protein McsA